MQTRHVQTGGKFYNIKFYIVLALIKNLMSQNLFLVNIITEDNDAYGMQTRHVQTGGKFATINIIIIVLAISNIFYHKIYS